MKVAVMPRDPNPYQELLHAELRRLGIDCEYVRTPTPSQTLNLLLRPLLLIVLRIRGFRVLHIHWVYEFQLPWVRHRSASRATRLWFSVLLRTARALGIRIVWTAHNPLPHTPVFLDDLGARRELVAAADAIIVHGDAAGTELRSLLGVRNVRVIPQGGYVGRYPEVGRAEARARLRIPDASFVATFVGAIERYKGVPTLLHALERLHPDHEVLVVIAGRCTDDALRSELEGLAATDPARVRLEIRYLGDEEIASHLSAADVAVFPFERVTNSGSVLLACSLGIPVVVPALAPLSDLPQRATTYYDGSIDGLVTALEEIARESVGERTHRGRSGRDAMSVRTWTEVASETVRVYDLVLAGEGRLPALQERVTR